MVLRTSSKTPVYPLLVDTNLGYTGNQINNVFISGALVDVANWCGTNTLMTGDFNGDGRTDQLCYGPASYTRVRLATAGGFGPPTPWLTSWYFNGGFFLGDFNGDGKTDVGDYGGAQDGYFFVGLSTGSSFNAPVSWGRSGLIYDSAEPPKGHVCNGTASITIGDFNGDGNSDVFCKKYGDTGYMVGLSNGASSFSFSVWTTGDCDWSFGAGDFNGDGKSDLYCMHEPNGYLYTFVSNGGAFPYGNGTYMLATFCATNHYVFGDFNADGKTDLACKGNGNVALSNGQTFVAQGAYGGWCTSGTATTGDFDGDGTTEIACNGAGSNVSVRKWQGNSLSGEQTWKTNWCGSGTTAGDFDGDGKTDLFCPTYGNPVAFAGSAGVRADLVVTAANGLGGTNQVTYVPSTNFQNTNNPGPSLVVTSLTVGDGRGGASTTAYTYAGGKVNRAEHQPLGFASATAMLPCIAGEATCPSTETSFMQDLASAHKLSTVVQRDQLGRPLTQKTFVYTTNGTTVPRTSLLTGEWTYTFDGSGATCPTYPCAAGKRTLQWYVYDSYGNPTRQDFSGDYDASGDETITTWSYRPNTTAYIVDRVAEQNSYGSTLANEVKKQAFSYDGQESVDLPPTKGAVTRSQDWLDTESRWVATSMVYDSFGNLTTTRDATDRPIITGFDPIYHVFPVSVCNGAGECETFVWDPVCGVPTQRTDVAGQSTTVQSDPLCRPTTATGPLGAFEPQVYLDFGLATQRVRRESPSATPEDGTGNDYVVEYFDGFGRTYRTVKKGPAPSQDIVIDTSYDARGQVGARTLPYYPADTPRATTFDYDALGRSTATIHPDGNSVSQTYELWTVPYGLWTVHARDEHSPPHVTTTKYDAYGRAKVKEQHINGQTLQTESTYDVMGRLIGMSDPVGNTWSWTYDWLGRNTARSDPDSGTWNFQYDDAGRMKVQTDAKSQQTDFTYDAAGRLETKVNADGTVTITRSEERTGFVNNGEVTTISSPGSVLKTDYDALGRAVRQVSTIDGVDYTAERRYDSGGRLRGITYPDGDAVGTAASPLIYDASGRLKGIPGITTEILYDAAGRAVQQANANGTSTARTYSSDRGFLTHISTSGPSTIQDLTYSPDSAGQVTQVASPFPNEGWTYAYDELHRLTQSVSSSDTAQNQAFEYDTVGNVTSNSRVGSYTYPEPGLPRPHAPTTVGTETMTYDANGNLTIGRGRSIQWRVDNLPMQINTTQFSYDGLGSRTKKVLPGSASIYPFGDDYEVTNGVITKYVAVDGLGVIAKRAGTQTFWLHSDRLGSIQTITDGTGTDIQRRTYRPYGEKIADTSAHTESRGYIGERQDEDTGLTYLHARYYDPALGVFLSPDPIGPEGGLNEYGYSFGNPVNGTDRSGLLPCGEDTPPEFCQLPDGPLEDGYGDGGAERRQRREEEKRIRDEYSDNPCSPNPFSPLCPTQPTTPPTPPTPQPSPAPPPTCQGPKCEGYNGGSGEPLNIGLHETVDVSAKVERFIGTFWDEIGKPLAMMAPGGRGLSGFSKVVRSAAQRRSFLTALAKSSRTPSWMRQWLLLGRTPPGYEVDHIVPLSIGGADVPSNMRLLLIADHRLHHKYYRPWFW